MKFGDSSLHHKRISKQSFNFILEKVVSKMSSWRAKTLSLASRITFSKTVLYAMPWYYFQTNRILASIYDNVDKICRNFILGNTKDKHGVHLVAWSDVSFERVRGSWF